MIQNQRKDTVMAVANLTLRFVTELLGIAAVGYAGLQLPVPTPLRIAAGVGGALALIAVWSLIVAPNTANGLTQPQKDLIGTGLLLVAAAAVGLAGQLQLAIGFAIVVLANTALLLVFGQDAREALRGMGR